MTELGIKTRHARILLGCLVLLTSIAMYGCAGAKITTKETSKPQQIHQVMQVAPQGGRSIVDYTKFLNAGDEVSGNIMVTELEVEFTDWATPWTFEAWAPDGVLLDTATIIYEDDPYHAFKFIAKITGEYTIRAIHMSLSPRNLDIVVSPAGWQLKETYTS
ncbi:MAG: hypothetical protein C4542_08850 [Dehalococcoidia bacterium]|nr:MAG: hypothetical protein C4542_08850 [Dehalococcoidia bacterium]